MTLDTMIALPKIVPRWRMRSRYTHSATSPTAIDTRSENEPQSPKGNSPDMHGMEPATSPPFSGWLFEVLGWVPALVFPIATGLQLLTILHRKNAEGVSIVAWTLFAVANICLFAYMEKYGEVESILGALGTASLNLCIVAAAVRYRRTSRRNSGPGPRVPELP
jgi:hypothetical protein